MKSYSTNVDVTVDGILLTLMAYQSSGLLK